MTATSPTKRKGRLSSSIQETDDAALKVPISPIPLCYTHVTHTIPRPVANATAKPKTSSAAVAKPPKQHRPSASAVLSRSSRK